MIAFVTGGTGCVGYALCRRLLRQPGITEVRVLARGGDTADVPAGCRLYSGTLDETSVLQEGCDGATVVYHAAAQVHSPDAPAADFERVNVGGTTKLLQAATNAGVSRFVYFSTVAVYGEDTPLEGIGEDAPPAPATPYAQTKLRGELLVQEWAERTGGTSVILRLATVYGARDRGNMARMMEAIRRGRFVLPGDGSNSKTCVAVDTAAGIAVNAGMSPGVPKGLPIVVADPHGAYTLREIARTMDRVLGVPQHDATRSVPVPVLRLVGGTVELLWRTFRPKQKPPLTVGQVDRLAANNVYRLNRMYSLTEGVHPVSLAEGLSASLAPSPSHAGG